MKSVMALVVAAGLAGLAQGAVTNGGFETGDFTGWSQFGNVGFTGVVDSGSGFPIYAGSYSAAFGPVGSHGGIQQTLAFNNGDVVRVSFALSCFDDGGNYFGATFSGQPIVTFVDSSGFDYTVFTADITVTGGNTNLVFETQHDPSYWLLDAVSAELVPAPGAAALLGLGGLVIGRRRR